MSLSVAVFGFYTGRAFVSNFMGHSAVLSGTSLPEQFMSFLTHCSPLLGQHQIHQFGSTLVPFCCKTPCMHLF